MTDFLNVKLGDQFNFNGYPMELIAVGSLLTEGGRVEIVQLQRLIELDESPFTRLMRTLGESGFVLKVQSEIIDATLGRHVKNISEMDEGECELAILAIESAMVDRDQLETERNDAH